MGYMRHHTIVVTWDKKHAELARGEALRIFNTESMGIAGRVPSLVSELVDSAVNGYSSFFVAPDGSKEWWGTSDNGNTCRELFINELRFMQRRNIFLDWVEVQFGDDEGVTRAIIGSHSDED